jgi:hypothetical protein
MKSGNRKMKIYNFVCLLSTDAIENAPVNIVVSAYSKKQAIAYFKRTHYPDYVDCKVWRTDAEKV